MKGEGEREMKEEGEVEYLIKLSYMNNYEYLPNVIAVFNEIFYYMRGQ